MDAPPYSPGGGLSLSPINTNDRIVKLNIGKHPGIYSSQFNQLTFSMRKHIIQFISFNFMETILI